MNEYTRSNAHTQILRTVKDFSRILELNSEKQKRRPLPGVVRRTFHVLYVAPVQWSVSNRFSSYPEVELGLTGPTSISTNIRTTCSKSLAVFVSNDSSLSVRPRILKLNSEKQRLKPFVFCPHGHSDRLRQNREPSSPLTAFPRILNLIFL